MSSDMEKTSPAGSTQALAAAVAAPVPATGADAASPLAEALRQALARVDEAVGAPETAEMVHGARKAIKEYRGLLRLIPGRVAATARREAAATARELAHARDRATALEALDMLRQAGLAREDDLEAARSVIGQDQADEREGESLRRVLLQFLKDTHAAMDSRLVAQANATDLVEGLRRGYRAARKADFSSAEAMHEVRKTVVTHRYQMSFLADWFKGKCEKRAARTQRLRDVLGAYQDIETLRPLLHANSAELRDGCLSRLDRAMTRLQKRLSKEARKRHRALFHRSSKDFARKLGKLDAPVRPLAPRTAKSWKVISADGVED